LEWDKVQAVIFDVDGTLYDQYLLRRRMLWKLMTFYIVHPWQISDLKTLSIFRREREKRILEKNVDIENAQYQWTAQASGVSVERVREIVNKFIHEVPLQYLLRYRSPGIEQFWNSLHAGNIKTAVFSDYPAADKLRALELPETVCFSATDKEIDAFKPNHKGLLYVADFLKIPVGDCLFIGDRDERDGECARAAGMPYLLIENKNSGRECYFQSYYDLIEGLERGNSESVKI
jgi:putative hydrolase of the HAD superfamily